jgi:hypothetical protein
MKFLAGAPIALAALPSLVSGHYFFPHLFVNDQPSQEFEYIRRSTQGFQPQFGFDILSSNDFRCNTGATPNDGTKIAQVSAGDTIGFGTNLAGNIQHPGPILAYMSRAPNDDVQSYDGSGDWFKIFELGANFPMDASGTNWLVWDMNRIDVQIPPETPSGQYLVRIEHVALHRPSGTEFYFNCALVEVTNQGNAVEPTDLVQIPGVYSSSTEGLSPNYSIYSGATSYPMPGPAVFPSGGEPPVSPVDSAPAPEESASTPDDSTTAPEEPANTPDDSTTAPDDSVPTPQPTAPAPVEEQPEVQPCSRRARRHRRYNRYTRGN